MRRLLGAMRSDDDVALALQAGLGNLAALSEQVGKAGLPVRVHVEGEPSRYPMDSTSPPTASSRRASRTQAAAIATEADACWSGTAPMSCTSRFATR